MATSLSRPSPRRRVLRPRVAAAALVLGLAVAAGTVVPAGAAPPCFPRPTRWPAPRRHRAAEPGRPDRHRGRGVTQVISYRLGTRTLGGRATALDSFTVNGTAHRATTTMKAAGSRATYTSTFAVLPGLTVVSTLTVTRDATVVFAVEKISGEAARTVRTL